MHYEVLPRIRKWARMYPLKTVEPQRLTFANDMAQELMRDAPNMTNVVEACSKENRQVTLDALLEQLEMCEKALQVW